MNVQKTLTFLFAFLTLELCAQVVITADFEQQLVGREAYFIIDEQHQLSLNDIRASGDWQPAHEQSLNFGSTQHAVWLRINIENLTKQSHYLQFDYPIIDTLEVFIIQEGTLIKSIKSGTHRKFKQREIQTTLPTFELPTGQYKVYVRATGLLNLQLVPRILDSTTFLERNNKIDFLQGSYIGIIVLALLAAVFIGIFTRDVIFFAYIGHLIGTAFITLHISGYAFEFIWNEYPIINRYEPMIFGLGIFSTLFAMAFLDTKNRSKRLQLLFWISVGANFLVYPLSLFGFQLVANQLVQLVGMLGCSLMLIAGVIFLKRGHKEARFFVVAWSVFLVGVIITILERVSVLPFNLFTLHASQIGSGLDVILLTLALADRVNLLRQEKDEARQKALETALEKEELINKQNQLLEKRVLDRTEELERVTALQNKLLSVIGHDLKGPVGQLRQSLEMLEVDPEMRTTEFMSMLKKASGSAFDLLNNLLEWSKTNQDAQLILEEVKLKDALQETLDFLKIIYTSKQVNIDVQGPDLSLNTNRELFITILRNVLSNAIKYSPSKSTITVRWDQNAIELTDEGPGMDNDLIKTIEQGNRIQSAQGTSGELGSGIGLMLTRDFLQRLNMKMELHSANKKGTTVRIDFSQNTTA